jgi:hypothetical protein
VTFDEDGSPNTWSADWEQNQRVEDFYGSVGYPEDPLLENQFALHVKMTKLFNPSGRLPLSESLIYAMQKADEFRTSNYEEDQSLYCRLLETGKAPETFPSPVLWSDDHHSNVIRCLLNLPIIRGQQSDTVLLRLLQRALIDAEEKSVGGITEDDIERAVNIEFEIFMSSYVCC